MVRTWHWRVVETSRSNNRRKRRNRDLNKSPGDGGDDDGGGGRKYPALSQAEIEQILNVPVFAITDHHGNGAVLSTNEAKNVVYFFLSQKMAETALASMQSTNKGMNLRVSALHLGKVWFKLLHNETMEKDDVELRPAEGSDLPPVRRKVSMRLVPEVRDLVGARLLQGLDPNDVPKLQEAIENDPEAARDIIRKAGERSSEFKEPYNQIPVFMVSQLRMQKKDPNGDGNAPGSMQKFPMFLSPKTMLHVYTTFVKNAPGGEDLEPTLQLGELHKIVAMMQHESEIDFRNVVLLPGGQDESDNGNGGGDSDEDDDNDGGDGGIEAEESESEEIDFANIEMTPYIEMGVFETNGPGLVPLQ